MPIQLRCGKLCSTNGLGSLFAPQEGLSGILLPPEVNQPDSRVDRSFKLTVEAKNIPNFRAIES